MIPQNTVAAMEETWLPELLSLEGDALLEEFAQNVLPALIVHMNIEHAHNTFTRQNDRALDGNVTLLIDSEK